MKNTRKTIAKIEDSLATDIPEAAKKRDLNKMVLALTDSVTNLVAVAKEMADALEAVTATPPEDGLHVKNDDAPEKPEKQVLTEAPKKKTAPKKKAEGE